MNEHRYPCNGLEGIQFGDLQKRGESKNREFYLELLRDFIAKHPQKIIWVKGGIKEREAYIVFDAEIHDELRDFWLNVFNENEQFAIRPLYYDEIDSILRKLRFGQRAYLGSLHVDYCVTPHDALTSGSVVVWEEALKGAVEEPYFCEFCGTIGSEGTWCNIDHRKEIPKEPIPA